MNKRSLALENLSVESFTTHDHAPGRGTVQARSGTTYADESCPGTCNWTCYPATCATCDWSCGCNATAGGATCNGTCAGATCGDTCNYATCQQPESCWMNIC